MARPGEIGGVKPRVALPGSGGYKRTRKLPSGQSAREQAVFTPGPWAYYTSSRVYRARYDSQNLILEIEWQDGGLSYVYYDVPVNVWRNMNRVVSVGKFVNRVLNQYSYAPKVD